MIQKNKNITGRTQIVDIFYRIISLLGGLSLFLYGMRIMGDGLKSGSGGAMRVALEKVTGNPFIGFLFGLLVTCMIQSSTATIVLTVGLVGAGYLTFRQSVGIVLGANVGTAITAQIIRLMDLNAGSGSILYFFKSDNLAPLALVIGLILIMFVKTRSSNNTGTVFMGFGILFVGLMNMSNAVSTMSDSLSRLLVSFENNYFLGFLAGAAVTGIIQSSSAVVGILQSIASSVGVTFCGVFAVIVGVNIGDCLTTFLVCRIGAKSEQIRTCMVHIIYNILAASLVFIVIAVLRGTGVISDSLWNMTLNSGGVANIHGLFRLVPAVLLLPLSNVLASIAERLVPDAPADQEDSDIEQNLRELDTHLVDNPGLALSQAEHLIGHMADVSLKNYRKAMEMLKLRDTDEKACEKIYKRIHEREELLDRMADASNEYLVALSTHIHLDSHLRDQNFQIKALGCFERIGDLAVNVADNLHHIGENGKTFSVPALRELNIAVQAVRDILQLTVDAYKNNDEEKARQVEPLEEVIDELAEYLRQLHVKRMTKKQCDVFAGIEYQNILLHLERLSDQCSDLAVYMLGRTNDSINGNEHEYIHKLHHSQNKDYLDAFQTNYSKYLGPLKEMEQY